MPIAYRHNRLSQQGLSLVEVMLILAVVGLILAASIIPLGELSVTEKYNREKKSLARAHDSISGYMAAHRTTARQVVVVKSTNNMREFNIPAGRPYLPCPDIDGDGYEDRVSFNVSGVALTGLAANTLTVNGIANTNDLLRVGNCAVTRGILPWKTLGLPAADGWGNRYTYEVDDVFSNAMVGFGQDIVADSFDPRSTVTISVDNRVFYNRRASHTLTLSRGGVDLSYVNDRRPIVVCDGSVETCQRYSFALTLQVGDITPVTLSALRKHFMPNDTVEGVPYVILSHGKNGYGAVNHQSNVLDSVVGGMVCNAPLYSTTAGAAAVRVAAVAQNRQHEAVNFPLVQEVTPNAVRYCPPITGLQNGHFVNQPRVNTFFVGKGNDSYDDIVTWKTRNELLQSLTEAGVPTEDFPVLRSY